jgi:tetratricopeptide (TPR) repeat protein
MRGDVLFQGDVVGYDNGETLAQAFPGGGAMLIGLKRRYLALMLLLPLVGIIAYQVGVYCWGSYHYRTAEQALERRDFAQASLHLQKCLEVWPNERLVRLLAAQTARRQGQFDEALHQLRLCARHNDSDDALILEHRLLRVQKGDLKEVDLLLSFCDEHPETPDTPLILEAVIEGTLKGMPAPFSTNRTLDKGEAAPRVKRTHRAVNLWLQLRPNPADQVQGLVWRSWTSALANDHLSAVADLRKALEIDPDHLVARLRLVHAVAQKAPQEALAHLEILSRRHPDKYQVTIQLATLYRGLGQLEEARQLLDEVLASHPKDVSALIERALLALDLDQLDEAESQLRLALSLAPNEPEVHLALSRCLRLRGREAEAKVFQEQFQRLEDEAKRNAH